jgi:hypothetical protein
MVEAVEPFKLYPTSMAYLYKLFEHIQLFGMGIWMHIHSVTTTYVPQVWESWPKSSVMQVCKPCYYAMVETVEPFKLHRT